jgi:ribosomal protein S4E
MNEAKQLKELIMELCRENGEVEIKGGIVFVKFEDGTKIDFTEICAYDEEGNGDL